MIYPPPPPLHDLKRPPGVVENVCMHTSIAQDKFTINNYTGLIWELDLCRAIKSKQEKRSNDNYVLIMKWKSPCAYRTRVQVLISTSLHLYDYVLWN